MPFNIQGPELIIILVIALVVLGPGRLPDVGSALGKSIREFRKAASDVKEATSLEPAKVAAPPPLPVAAEPPIAPVEPARIAAPSGDGPVVAAPAVPEPVAEAPADRDATVS